MKLPSIIYSIVLGLSASVQAQEKATNLNEPSKRTTPAGQLRKVPDPAVTIGTDGAGAQTSRSIISIEAGISGGRLADAIATIENRIRGDGAGAQPMPNLIYSAADIPELALPGEFRLSGVTPVQAVALACAAAGCTLDPIYAPAEGTFSSEAVQTIIGYRIVRDSAQNPLLSGSKPINFTGTGSVERIKSDIAAATAKITELRDLRARYTEDHPSVIAGEKELVNLQRALEQSTVESKRRGDFFSATQGGGGGTIAPVSQSSFGGRRDSLLSSPQAAPSADGAERVVRVYALGAILGGGEGSAEELKRRYALIGDAQDLIARTLENADIKADKSPEISLHSDLRVIVAKATAAQHDIILQVLQALKENEMHTAQTARPSPSAETIPAPTPAPSAEKPKSNP